MISTSTLTYLGQTSLAVSFLICLVLVVRKPFAKAFGAKAAYALWLVPMLRLIMPPVPANWTLFGWMQFGQSATPIAPSASPAVMAPPIELVTENARFIATPVPGAVPVPPTTISSVEPLAEPSVLAVAADALTSALPALGIIWLLGVIAVIATGIIRQMQASKIVAAEGEHARLLVQTAAMDVGQAIGLKHKNVSVQTSFISSGPLVIGLFRPIVLLPAWFELDYTPAEQRVAIMHEMMHVKRGDLWALQAAWIGVALQWFNPLAWMALKTFRIDQEAACDADVLSIGEASPHSYGATLVKAVRISRPVAQPVHAASLPLNHALHERLSQMKNPLPTARQRFNGSLLAASVGAAALLASACAASTAQTADLAGAPEGQSSSTEKRTLVINDGDTATRTVTVIRDGETVENFTVDIDLEDLADLAELEALSELEGLEGLEDLTELEALGGMAVFVGEDGASTFTFEGPSFPAPPHIAPPAGVAAFQSEMRELAKDPEANAAEIKALSDAFEAEMEAWEERHDAEMATWEETHEARMEAWEKQHEARAEAMERTHDAHTRLRVLRHNGKPGGNTLAWSGRGGAVSIECDEDTGSQRVVSIQRGDGEQRTVTSNCSSVSADRMNVEDIMAELRENGDLSEERLAEVEERLEAAREKLEGMNFEFNIEEDVEIEEN